MCNHSIIKDLSIIHHVEIIKETEEASEEEVVEEEALEEVEDQLFVITVRNQGTMQETSHNHLRHVCIVMQQTMKQKIVQHF
jgi:hypothetical protein